MAWSFRDISLMRLRSQQITGTRFSTVKELVGWMGAVQAQDFAMAKWAVGVRLPESTEQIIDAAINEGEILRTHVLRPTWHLVRAEDIYWLLDLTAPRIRASLKSRHKELGLTEAVCIKSNAIIEKSLSGGRHRTREELVNELGKGKIATDRNRASHLLLRAELDAIICSGAANDKHKPTYALLRERVPKPRRLTKEEALAEIARRYYSSRGPATLKDFVWWSGLPVRDAREALEMAGSALDSEMKDEEKYWFGNSVSKAKNSRASAFLLPAYDEFVISYRDRRPSLSRIAGVNSFSSNGVFKPLIVVDGQVTGVWKRKIGKDEALIATEFFQQVSASEEKRVRKAAKDYGRFLGQPVRIL